MIFNDGIIKLFYLLNKINNQIIYDTTKNKQRIFYIIFK